MLTDERIAETIEIARRTAANPKASGLEENLALAVIFLANCRAQPAPEEVRAQIKEECAKVCDAYAEWAHEELKTCPDFVRQSRINFASAGIALGARIRALGAKPEMKL